MFCIFLTEIDLWMIFNTWLSFLSEGSFKKKRFSSSIDGGRHFCPITRRENSNEPQSKTLNAFLKGQLAGSQAWKHTHVDVRGRCAADGDQHHKVTLRQWAEKHIDWRIDWNGWSFYLKTLLNHARMTTRQQCTLRPASGDDSAQLATFKLVLETQINASWLASA